MSWIGNPYDNAKAERFMRTLKEEKVGGIAYCDVVEARTKIWLFIETVYKRQQLHSAPNYLTPEEYEENWPRQRPLRAVTDFRVSASGCISEPMNLSTFPQ